MGHYFVDHPEKSASTLVVARRGFQCEECEEGVVSETVHNNRPIHRCDNPACAKEYPNLVL